MSEPERFVRALTLLCAVPDGKGVAHGAPVGVVGLEDGEVIRIGGASKGRVNGEGCWIAPCPKHGVLVVRDSELRKVFESQRSHKQILKLGVSHRLPVLKTRREKNVSRGIERHSGPK
jgi:hypothetical protein